MRYINRITVTLFTFLIFSKCTMRYNKERNGIKENINNYKKIVTYLKDKNYHDAFKEDIACGRERFKDDSMVYSFLVKNDIFSIQTYGSKAGSVNKNELIKDSIIVFYYFSMPVIGKRKELVFDFSSSKIQKDWRRGGTRLWIMDEGIYYVTY